MDKALSVIIPTFNRVEFAERSVRSVRHTIPAMVEVIVVDDGGAVSPETAVVTAGATYIRQKNAGPATARNTGFASSRGRFVSFLDDDDEWTPEGALRLVQILDRNPDIDVVFADNLMGNSVDGFASFVDTYGSLAFHALPHDSRAADVRVLDRRPFLLQLSTRNVMFLGSTLFRREFFERLGGFDASLRGAADWELFMRAAATGVVAYSPGPPTCYYYKHEGGMSKDDDHMYEDFIRALDAVLSRASLSDEERRHIEARLRAHVFSFSWQAYDRGDYRVARERLDRARALGAFGGREALYSALLRLPGPLLTSLRSMKRGVQRWRPH